MHPSGRPDVEAAVRPAAGRGDRLPAPESAGRQRRGRPRDRPPDRSASGAGTRADARGRRGAGDDRRLVGARKQGRRPMRERGSPGTSQQGGGLSHAQASQGPEVGSLFTGETAALMRTVDWSATPLGPVERWPPALRSALSLCLGSPVPMMIWWGPELVTLYNDAYRPILGSRKHPRALGRPGRECWLDIWNVIGPMLEGALWRGEATFSDDLLLPLDRPGVRERRTHARGKSGRHSLRAALPARGGRQARPSRGRDRRRARPAAAQRDARGDGVPRHHLAARAGGTHGPWRADERPRRALRCVADEPLGRRSAVRPGAAGGAAGAGRPLWVPGARRQPPPRPRRRLPRFSRPDRRAPRA